MEETEEELRGEMSDDLHLLDLESGKWHRVTLRAQAAQAAARPAPEPVSAAPVDTVTGEMYILPTYVQIRVNSTN